MGRGSGGWLDRLSSFPALGWGLLYYAALLTAYRYLAYEFAAARLDRQLPGFVNILAVTAVLFAYLLTCSLPPFLRARSSRRRPLWRGMECFACYLLVSLALGAVFAAFSEGSWNTLSGVCASGAAWARIGSFAALVAVFAFASWRGGKYAEAHRRRVKRRRRR